jgi:hypothetical protein
MLAAAAFALALAAAPAPAPAPAGVVTDMTPALVEQALQEGRVKAKGGLLAGLFGKVSLPGQYPQGGRKKPCFLMTPYSRVVFASHLAFSENRALTAPRVSPVLLQPELWVVCSPITRSAEGPSDVRTISLVTGGRAVAALRMETSRELYRDKFGFTYPALGMTAVFPLSAAQADAEVNVIYSGYEDSKFRLDLTAVR